MLQFLAKVCEVGGVIGLTMMVVTALWTSAPLWLTLLGVFLVFADLIVMRISKRS